VKSDNKKPKRRKKINTADRVRAVLLAAVIILIAALAFRVTLYSARSETQSGALLTIEAPIESGSLPASVEPASPSETRPSPAGQIAATGTSAALPAPRTEQAARPAITTASFSPDLTASRGTLAFVIDDAGHNLRDLEPFLKLPWPLTIAVLPGLPYSAEAARRVRSAGKELFLHQPMEALGGQNPGPLAIRVGMGIDEIRAIINGNLDEIGPVAGMNNHEGSRVTMDLKAMEAVLSVCRERGVVFLDSRTTAETAAPMAARMLGMAIGERDVFVDNVQNRESITGFIKTGLARAEQKGAAIMIGHVWSPDLAPLLAELFPDLARQGYSFSSALNLIRGTGQ
jgi:polysaccharide deacetylase 2 family uncharacterized protein YibQ